MTAPAAKPIEQRVSLLQRFVRWNFDLSMSLMPRVFRDGQASDRYYAVARETIASCKPAVVVDVGAGRNWPLGEASKREHGFRLVGTDIDASEMALNPLLDERIVGDASRSLGVAEGTADVVLSHFTIEHIPDNASFVAACHRALSDNGRLVIVFQGKWAPSSILNRLIPHKLARVLLHRLFPGADGHLGFRAYYDHCAHSKFRKLLTDRGFAIEYEYNSYYNSSYFAFFVPLFILSLGIDYLRMKLGARDLATQCLFEAKKVR